MRFSRVREILLCSSARMVRVPLFSRAVPRQSRENWIMI